MERGSAEFRVLKLCGSSPDFQRKPWSYTTTPRYLALSCPTPFRNPLRSVPTNYHQRLIRPSLLHLAADGLRGAFNGTRPAQEVRNTVKKEVNHRSCV